MHMRTQKFAGKSVPETTTRIRVWDEDVINFTSMGAIFKVLYPVPSKLKGEYKNLKSSSGTSVTTSLSPHSLSLKTILVTLSL